MLIPITRATRSRAASWASNSAPPVSDGRDHAVEHPPWPNPDASAAAVDPRRRLEVSHGVEVQQFEPCQEAAQFA